MKRQALCLAAALLTIWTSARAETAIDETAAARLAGLALACVGKEYPNKLSHHLNGEDDVKPPHVLTPAFFGCYDWHSAVHGHWLLLRLLKTYPAASFATAARAALARALTPENMAVEARYLEAAGRSSFERPYGLAWLLQLSAELKDCNDPQAPAWAAALRPLEQTASRRLKDWLPKLTHPIRIGEHAQTAFAFGLAWDWARAVGDKEMTQLLRSRIVALYGADRGCPLNYEPSGEDFFSPCLAEADLMRRTMPQDQFAAWLTAFLPVIPEKTDSAWLPAAVVRDPEDPRLGHLNGLNLSRAWMLEGIIAGLPAGDARLGALRAAASAHRAAGLASVTQGHYMGGHWLGSFAAYLVTGRGLR